MNQSEILEAGAEPFHRGEHLVVNALGWTDPDNVHPLVHQAVTVLDIVTAPRGRISGEVHHLVVKTEAGEQYNVYPTGTEIIEVLPEAG